MVEMASSSREHDRPPTAPAADHASAEAPSQFLAHARTFAGLTLISRVLGLVRDAILTRALGLSSTATAFNIAFQFPNTFRRLFGEGALSAAMIPEYAGLLKHDRELAHRFASLVLGLLATVLGGVMLLAGLVIGIVLAAVPLPEDGRRALLYLLLMLPYMPLVCITAMLGGMLQTHGRFAAQAGAPIILNLCMIAAALLASRGMGAEPPTTALLVSGAVTLAGVLQALWCWRDLRGRAVWMHAREGAWVPARRMLKKMTPVVIGLGAAQVATLIESWILVGWPLYFGPTILGRAYPLDDAAGAALYNAQRLYQFPLGVFGVALATAVFPLLARQADEPARFRETLRRGIRLSVFIGLPATAGLVLVAPDLAATIYLGGRVSAADARRIADLLVAYSAVVGSYSLIHVLNRAFYALGDTALPARLGIASAFSGLLLGAALMWIWREAGLALAASLVGFVQVGVLLWAAHGRLRVEGAGLIDGETGRALGRIALAAGLMSALLALGLWWIGDWGTTNWPGRAARLAAFTLAGALSYTALARRLCREEWRWMFERGAARDR